MRGMTMNRQIVEKYGFKYVGACNCSGTLTEKYFNGRFTVSVMPRRRLFKIRENNLTVVPLTNWMEIEKQLIIYAAKKVD